MSRSAMSAPMPYKDAEKKNANARTWYATNRERIRAKDRAKKLAAKPKRDCVACGDPIPAARRRDAKYCSDECTRAEWYDDCVVCGQPKPPGLRPHAKYCSPLCKSRSPSTRAAVKRWAQKNPEKRRASYRAYYMANLEEQREKGRAYYHANPERARENWLRYREANPEKVRAIYANYDAKRDREERRAWARANYAANREKIRERSRPVELRYAKANPHRQRERDRLRRANGGRITSAEWEARLAEYDGRCAYCGEPGSTMDHVVPLIRGGPHTIENVVPACSRCNSSKGSKLMSEWRSNG
jgi:5-methylcytosine-specific restriction endonuclease McrA/predicted nucleic acid-binding Zn ribbon protein